MFTSSELDDLLSEPKSKANKEAGKLSESSKDYVYDKVSEQITNGTILDYKELNNKEVKWGPVSYTHLDVYKRQIQQTGNLFTFPFRSVVTCLPTIRPIVWR